MSPQSNKMRRLSPQGGREDQAEGGGRRKRRREGAEEAGAQKTKKWGRKEEEGGMREGGKAKNSAEGKFGLAGGGGWLGEWGRRMGKNPSERVSKSQEQNLSNRIAKKTSLLA